MSAYQGHRIKDRSYKVTRRRDAMPVTGRSVFVVQSIIVAKADEAKRHIDAQRALDTKRARR